MEARILLAADFANIDPAGKLNIIGAFNRIFMAEFPGRHPVMYLVIRLTVELGEFDRERSFSVTLYDEDGNISWKTPDLKFTVHAPQQQETRTGDFQPILLLQNMEFAKPGRYEFRVVVNDDLKGSIPIDVEKRELPPKA